MIIGITGTIGAGKGTVARYLEEKGFKNFSVREFLLEELSKRGLPHDREHMTPLANELRRTYGPAHIIQTLYAKAGQYTGNSIIESIRNEGEILFLKTKPDFHLLAVDADQKVRYNRIVLRGSTTDAVTFETFQAQEEKESKGVNPWEQNLSVCIANADAIFVNNGTFDELKLQVEKYLDMQ
ncbi:MAG: AAA family ATPase [Candidatus Pacebacteria bacterium]|jgi:dephospho-CoA kinase|nr:AAA family ATPase [Candidatus Paceibacterota bacterium]